MQTPVKVLNTAENQKHLKLIGREFLVTGRLLEVHTNYREDGQIERGEITVRSFKKNVLGL